MAKKILQDLREEQERICYEPSFIDVVLQSIQQGVLFISMEGILLTINGAARTFLTKQSLKPNTDLSEMLPDDFFGFSMKDALYFRLIHEKVYRTINRREFEVSSSFHSKGKTDGLVLILTDITEKREIHTKIQRAHHLEKLGQMVASVTHEIRNSLGGIRGYSTLLFRDLYDQKHMQEMAGQIVNGTRALERLVSGVLQFAKPVKLNFESTEIGKFLRKFVRFIKTDPSKPRRIELKVHFPEDPFLAPIDQEALNMALLNLIFNGYQAMPSGGTLTLTLLKVDTCYQIAISDTGIGMREEEKEKIFSPFFTTKKKGNGIGLSEVEKIIKAHSGEITVRSALLKGTTFTLILPLQRV